MRAIEEKHIVTDPKAQDLSVAVFQRDFPVPAALDRQSKRLARQRIPGRNLLHRIEVRLQSNRITGQPETHRRFPQGKTARERHRTAEIPGGALGRIRPAVRPADQDTGIRVVKGDARIIFKPLIEPERRGLHPFRAEGFPVKETNEILRPGTALLNIHPHTHEKNIPRPCRGRQLKQIRAFPHTGRMVSRRAKFSCFLPMDQILRREKFHMIACGQHHPPAISDPVPENFRIPKIDPSLRAGNHRVSGILCEVHAVQRISDALVLTVDALRLIILRVHRNDGRIFRRSKAGDILGIKHGRAGKDRPKLVRAQCDRQVLPVDQIGADGVPPVHRSPDGILRMMLIEQMIFPVRIDKTIRIIRPHFWGRKMNFRPEIAFSNSAHKGNYLPYLNTNCIIIKF